LIGLALMLDHVRGYPPSTRGSFHARMAWWPWENKRLGEVLAGGVPPHYPLLGALIEKRNPPAAGLSIAWRPASVHPAMARGSTFRLPASANALLFWAKSPS
jgi:hypothetical protein